MHDVELRSVFYLPKSGTNSVEFAEHWRNNPNLPGVIFCAIAELQSRSNSIYNLEMRFLKILPIKNSIDTYDLFFRIGMGWRIMYGFLRLILGFILLRLIGTPISGIFYKIMSHELIEDPTDLLIRAVSPFFQHSSFTVTYFLAIYLIFWGVVDILLSINLLRHKMWAFSASIYLIGAFVLYEIYRFSYTRSLVLAYVIILDLILLWLIGKEYNKLKFSSLKSEI